MLTLQRKRGQIAGNVSVTAAASLKVTSIIKSFGKNPAFI